MNKSEYKIMEKTANKHWWYSGRRKIVKTLIENFVPSFDSAADVGAGTGENLIYFANKGKITALEMNNEAIETIKKHFFYMPNLIVKKWKYPEELNEKFDLILLTDVLEHIKDDKGIVNWIYEHLNKKGYCLITVPAHQFLWTQMDEVAKHYKRYNIKEIKELFSKFQTIKLSYYNFFLFPIKFAFALIVNTLRKFNLNNSKRSYNEIAVSGMFMRIINEIMKVILKSESKILLKRNLPFGVSIVGLFQKL